MLSTKLTKEELNALISAPSNTNEIQDEAPSIQAYNDNLTLLLNTIDEKLETYRPPSSASSRGKRDNQSIIIHDALAELSNGFAA